MGCINIIRITFPPSTQIAVDATMCMFMYTFHVMYVNIIFHAIKRNRFDRMHYAPSKPGNHVTLRLPSTSVRQQNGNAHLNYFHHGSRFTVLCGCRCS